MPRRRGQEPGDRELARARLAALRPRAGWVPRVPDPPETWPEETGPKETWPTGTGSAESWPAADAWFGPLPAEPGPDASRPSPAEPGEPAAAPVPDPRPGPGRHRAGGVTDRLPVALRAAAARSLPEPVRRGRAGLDTGQAVVVLVVAVLAVAGAAVVLWTSRPQVQPAPVPSPTVEVAGTPVPTAGGAPHGAAPGATGTVVPPTGGEVVVHVAGRVAQAGVVRLPAGSRVADALEAAGGPEAGVDLTPLNLARVLGDGEQVLVGVEPAPGAAADTGAVPGGPAPGAPPGDPRVDLNTATAAELEALPGVGPVLAGRIVAWREQNGRFSSTDELREVSGIGPKTFESLAELVRV